MKRPWTAWIGKTLRNTAIFPGQVPRGGIGLEHLEAEVAVIGSGVGGMCAAALLAYAGYKTIVVESLGFLGGRYSCIDYKGYEIATGGHMVNYGKDDPIVQTLKDVHAAEIQFKEFRVPVKYRIDGKDYDLEGKGGLRRIVSAASRDEAEAERVMGAMYRAMREEEPSNALSLKDWLLQSTDNPRVHNIFQCQATAFTGVNAHDFPAREFVRFLRTYARLRETLVPRKTGKSIIDALKKAIEDAGGLVLTTTRAIQIRVRDGRTRGIVAEREGKRLEIEAKVVISNIGPTNTVKLAGRQNFEQGYLQQISENVRSSVAMDYIIVSDRPLLDSLLFTVDARRTEAWSPTSLFWPEDTPRGKHVMEGYAVPLSSDDYDPREEYETFLQDLREEFPSFEECGGRVLLARQFCGDWPVNRCFQGYDPPQETPVDFLYNVGDGVKPSGWVGASGAALSGRWVAKDVRERLS
jgi:phytoene dehydrogenase-like protein